MLLINKKRTCVMADQALPALTLPPFTVWFCCHLSAGMFRKGPCSDWQPGAPFEKALKWWLSGDLRATPCTSVLTVNSLCCWNWLLWWGADDDEGNPASFSFQSCPPNPLSSGGPGSLEHGSNDGSADMGVSLGFFIPGTPQLGKVSWLFWAMCKTVCS